jgi:hypothetical protein
METTMGHESALLGMACTIGIALVGCSSSDTTGVGGGGPMPSCTDPTAVPCSDQVILGMSLQPTAAPGLIETVADGEGWISLVDATAGGFGADPPHSYVYGKFADTGLEKVAISDEASLDSMAWDIAFRRYVIRINSGNSGPSCVTAARLPGSPPPAYDSVTTVPEGLIHNADEYFTAAPDCSFIPDGTGLPDSPATALSSYWEFPGCVAMTGNVFVLALADGRHVRLTVTEYYWDAQAADPEAGQVQCDGSATVPTSGAAFLT